MCKLLLTVKLWPALLLAVVMNFATAAPVSISQTPLFLNLSAPNPNILIIFDNSQSMDGTMAGKLIAGSDPTTRSNIARSSLLNLINTYPTQFNWGLETFGYSGTASLLNTYAYYLGTSSTMFFTNDCVNGISASNGGLRCVANPDAVKTCGQYITYGASGDDSTINDVLYTSNTGGSYWAVAPNSGTSTNYYVSPNHTASSCNWTTASFPGYSTWSFTPTDAGFLSSWPTYTRQLYLPRAWGYNNGISGAGNVLETVQANSTTHTNNLTKYLAAETNSNSTSEIKNAAIYTPLTGSIATAQSYFSGTSSPISNTCQKNFIVLATDGNPTGQTNGNQYAMSAWAQSALPSPSQAYLDVYNQIISLRTTSKSSTNYDIQTYVIGLGDSVANPVSVTGLNQMANYGGTNNAYLANNQAALDTAFASIASDIVSKTASASAVALNSGSWSNGDSLYQARFSSSDWSGQLLAYAISSTGALSATAKWDAAQVLKGQDYSSGRNILTYKPSALLGSHGIPFRWPVNSASPTSNELDSSQITALNTNTSSVNDGYGSYRLDFLRGRKTNEAATCGTCTLSFRSRATTVLGDIINSSPVFVSNQSYGYPISMESVSYINFVNSNANRTPMIYVGANDGMLHAFKASDGSEAFAYAPGIVYSKLSALPSSNYLTSHLYSVDGTPTVGDVFYETAGAWHTLLASGLRAGGKGVFVLDITSPNNFTETNAKNVVRWEFTNANDSDMGYVFGQPLLVKTNNGRWSVIVANGYDNTLGSSPVSASGHALLYVIDAENGTLTAKIDTMVGSTTTPNGLSGPVATDATGNHKADYVYAGDLQGNMWKFDLSSTNPSSWGVAFSGTPLFAAGQPIVSRPDITLMPTSYNGTNVGGYMVTFGTGEYLGIPDLTSTTQQSFYGIWDNGTTAGSSLTSLIKQQIVTSSTSGLDGNTYRITTHVVDAPTDSTALSTDNTVTSVNYYKNYRGWYMQFPSTGSNPAERVIVDPSIVNNSVVFNTMLPSSGTCSSGGSGWVMEVNAINGDRLDTATFDTNNSGSLNTADYVSYNGKAYNMSGRQTSSIPASPGFLTPPTTSAGAQKIQLKYINGSDSSITRITENGTNYSHKRAGWVQIK